MLKSQKARLDAPEMDSLRLGTGWKVEELGLPQIFVAGTHINSADAISLTPKRCKAFSPVIPKANVNSLSDGMIPKLKNCIDAIEEGVNRVHILDGRIPHSLLLEIFTNKGIGTAILREDGEKYYNEHE